MDLFLIEEALLSNKAALFDIASLLGVAGLVLFIFKIRFDSRILGYISASLILICLAGTAGLWILEGHYQRLAVEKQKSSPYYLSGYYYAH